MQCSSPTVSFKSLHSANQSSQASHIDLTLPVQRAQVDNRGDLVYQGDLVIEDIPNKQLRDDIRRLRSVECWHRVGDCFNALVRTGNFDEARALLSWEEMMKSCANVLFDPRYGGDVIPRERHKACLPCREARSASCSDFFVVLR